MKKDGHVTFFKKTIFFKCHDNILRNKPLLGTLLLRLIRSLWKHFRAVSLCLFLLIFPAYMAYMICQFFHMDFWLLIIISSSILTSLQVTQDWTGAHTHKPAAH